MPVQPWHTWDLDHWPIPASQGGSDEQSRPAHSACNQAAGRQLQKDAARARKTAREGGTVFLDGEIDPKRVAGGIPPQTGLIEPTFPEIAESASNALEFGARTWDTAEWLNAARKAAQRFHRVPVRSRGREL